MSTIILTLYPGYSFEVILNVKFYLKQQYTLLTPCYSAVDALFVSRQYIDTRLLVETMLVLFNYNQFELDHFLTTPAIRQYGDCHLIGTNGYKSKTVVCSFTSGYNVTLHREEIDKIKSATQW
jgi:hypothetical protein